MSGFWNRQAKSLSSKALAGCKIEALQRRSADTCSLVRLALACPCMLASNLPVRTCCSTAATEDEVILWSWIAVAKHHANMVPYLMVPMCGAQRCQGSANRSHRMSSLASNWTHRMTTTSFTHGFCSRSSLNAEKPVQNNLLHTVLQDTTFRGNWRRTLALF